MSHVVTIKAKGGGIDYWKELWHNRQLLWILSKRDVSVRYKQTSVGVAWSVIRPFMTMLVMVFAFSVVAKLRPDPGVPYPLMVLGGITIWTFFSNTFSQISNSILMNANLVSKVYFPRLIMPLSAVAVGFIDFLISFALFVILCIYYQYWPTVNIIFLPFFILLTLVSAMGFGLFFATLNVRFRDIGQLIPFLIQIGFYVSPIAWSSTINKDKSWYAYYYIVNPIAGLIEGFRWCTLGDKAFFDPTSLYSTIITSFVALLFSIMYFRKKENTFVDHI